MNNIKVGAINYKIRYTDELDTETCGMLKRTTNTIYIDSSLPRDQQDLTLLHEIIHAINGEISEEVVDGLAVSLHQIIVDNNLFEEKNEGSPK